MSSTLRTGRKSEEWLHPGQTLAQIIVHLQGPFSLPKKIVYELFGPLGPFILPNNHFLGFEKNGLHPPHPLPLL